jgi:outer membrane pore protein F
MNVYAAYQFNLLDDTRYVRETGTNKNDQFALGIVYQF